MRIGWILAVLTLAGGAAAAGELFFDGGFDVQHELAITGASRWVESTITDPGGYNLSPYSFFSGTAVAGTGIVDAGDGDYKLQVRNNAASTVACMIGENLTGLTEGTQLTFSVRINGTVGGGTYGVTFYLLPRWQFDLDGTGDDSDGAGVVTWTGGSLAWDEANDTGNPQINYRLAPGVYDNYDLVLHCTLPATCPSSYGGFAPCTAPYEALMLRISTQAAAHDFTMDDFSLYLPAIETLVPGDYDGDGTVGQSDLDLVLLNWGAAPPLEWIHGAPTGIVGQAELDGVLLNWGARTGEAVVTPEPMSLALLAIGGLALLARRS